MEKSFLMTLMKLSGNPLSSSSNFKRPPTMVDYVATFMECAYLNEEIKNVSFRRKAGLYIHIQLKTYHLLLYMSLERFSTLGRGSTVLFHFFIVQCLSL